MKILGKEWKPKDAGGGRSSRGPHRLQAALQCERKWLLSYGGGRGGGFRRRYGSELPILGTLLHTYAADYHASKLPEPPSWLYEKTLGERLLEDAGEHAEGENLIQQAGRMWLRVREQDHDEREPYAVEREVHAPLGEIDPHCPPSLRDEAVTARLDLIAWAGEGAAAGQLVVDDYKTTGSNRKKTGLPKWDPQSPRWSMHWQGALGLVIARAMFQRDVFGFFIHRVQRDPPHMTDRRLLEIPEGLVNLAGQMATRAVQEEFRIVDKRTNRLPVLPTGAMTDTCSEFGGCDFLDFCQSSTAEARSRVLQEQFYRRP